MNSASAVSAGCTVARGCNAWPIATSRWSASAGSVPGRRKRWPAAASADFLFDLDDVCVTNTNRQVHAIEGSVGKAKVEVMAARIRAINPACRVHAMADFVTRETMAEYIVDFDYLIDCIDSVAAKAALIAWCKRRKIPVITTGGAGGQVDRRRSRSPT